MRTRALIVGTVLLVATGAAAQVTNRTDNDAPIFPGPEGVGTCPIVIDGTLGSGSPSWPAVSGVQTGRLNRNGIASTCAVPKACLIFDNLPGRAFDAYNIRNGSGAAACVIVQLEVLTQAACNLQSNAYLETYDPKSICVGYLGDPGLSSGTPPTPTSFEVTVPAGDDLLVVVHTTNPGEIGCEYELTFSGDCIPVELQSFDIE